MNEFYGLHFIMTEQARHCQEVSPVIHSGSVNLLLQDVIKWNMNRNSIHFVRIPIHSLIHPITVSVPCPSIHLGSKHLSTFIPGDYLNLR